MPVIGPPPAGTTVSLRIVGGTTSELDLTQYMILQEGEGFDPADGGFLEPVFNESAFGAGQSLVNLDVKNKEFQFPLHLKAATKDSLHTLFRTLRLKLDEPEVFVEWRDGGASLVTYYDIEFARFDPDYKFFRARHSWMRGVLRCWVRPYGHTATERLVGTAVASGFAAPVITIAPLSGDTPARAQFKVTVASHAYSNEFVAVGVLPNTNYLFRWPAASMALTAPASGIRVGASGAAGSQFIGYVGVPGGGVTLAKVTFPNPGAMSGRHRVLGIARSGQASPINLYVNSDSGTFGGTAAVDTADWSLYDFGVWGVPSHLATQAARSLTISFLADASSALVASYRAQINELYLLPEESTCVLSREPVGLTDISQYLFDGPNNTTTGRDSASSGYTAYDAQSQQRGQIPAVAPGATTSIAVLRTPGGVGGPANLSVSAEVRVREQFSFQR